MKIVIVTPLYPPDVADPAPYVKELATRLTADHNVTVVTYGRLPEEIPGVLILTADKRLPALVRAFRFTLHLMRALRGADLLYLQSGASAELPVFLACLWYKTPLIMRKSTERTLHGLMRRTLRSQIERRATVIETTQGLVKPEILPFAPYPEKALAAYRSAWEAHLAEISEHLPV